jgi:flagellar hook-basal body complex protein FliE
MKINQFVPDSRIFEAMSNSQTLKANLNTKSNGISFMETLKEKLDAVNDKQIHAEVVTEKFIKGDDVDIHQVMLATEEAKLSLQLAVQIRNKLVEAYQEINRMQL